MALADTDVERALVVVAHPDDVEIGAAGTVATWTDAGIAVTYCVVTDGDAGGGFDAEASQSEIGRVRQAEQRAAAAEVGVTDVRFLGYPDGLVYATHELRRDISRVIRDVRPQRVLTQSPDRDYARFYASHPDHLAVGEATLAAVYPDARNPFAHPELLRDEGLAGWAVAEVWLMAHDADRWIDVTATMERKMTALRRHVSQMAHITDLDNRMRGWLTMQAKVGGLPKGNLAETFRVVDTA